MKAVILNSAYRIWNAGEVAGFPDEEADALISSGIARPVAGSSSVTQEDDGHDEGKAPAEGKRGKR